VTYRRSPFKSDEPSPKPLLFWQIFSKIPKETFVLVVVSKSISHFEKISHKKKDDANMTTKHNNKTPFIRNPKPKM